MAVLLTTNHGNIKLELDAEKAPKTVENFLNYVRSGHYDGTIFHRVIDGFMIQGGGFEPGMKQKSTKPPIKNEAPNGLANARGSIAMARLSDPDTATSQFYINVVDNPGLDESRYCVFGKVTSGMDVVDKIKAVPTGMQARYQDVPRQDVVIHSVRRG